MATLQERLEKMQSDLDKQVGEARPEMARGVAERANDFITGTSPDEMNAFLRGTLGGGLESTGMAAGYQVGKRFGPLGAGLGAGAGYLGGMAAKDWLGERKGLLSDQPLTFGDLSQLPEDERPYGAAGETAGASIPFALTPFAVNTTKAANTLLGKFVRSIGETAQQYPTTYAIGEAGGIAGAATGSGVAEKLAPGNQLAKTGAEIAGGAAAPVRVPMMAARGMSGITARAMRTVSKTGQENEAARVLKGIVETAGEDPDAIVRAIDSAPPGLTSVEATLSPVMRRMENTLVAGDAAFGRELQHQRQGVYNDLKANIQALTDVGTPAALQAAAKLRDRQVRTLIEAKVNKAGQDALDAVSKLQSGAPTSDISNRIWNTIDRSLKDSRDQEKQLWGAVNQNAKAITDNQRAAYDEVKNQLLPVEADKMPPIIEQWIKKIQPDKEGKSYQASVRELILARSRFLGLAREAADKREWADANAYGKMADGVLADLSASFGAGDPAYDTARAFSHALHDAFTRTFAGAALDTGPAGRFRIPPEVLGSRMMSGPGAQRALRFQEARDAARFLPSQGYGTDTHINTMMEAQQDFLLNAAGGLTGRDGHVSPERLYQFQKANQEVLAAYPETAKLLATAEKAEDTFKTLTEARPITLRRLTEEAAFVRIAGGGNTTEELGRILGRTNRMQYLNQLALLTKKDGPEAVSGMRGGLMNWAFETAGGEMNFDPAKWRALLTKPLAPHEPSLATFMQTRGLITGHEAANLRNVADVIDARTNAVKDPRVLKNMVMTSDFMTDFALRILGARIGSVLAEGSGSGAPIVIAGAGSRAIRTMFDKVPVGKTKDLLEKAALDPQFAKILLMKDVPSAIKPRLGTQMQAYLIDAGLLSPLRNLEAQAKEGYGP